MALRLIKTLFYLVGWVTRRTSHEVLYKNFNAEIILLALFVFVKEVSSISIPWRESSGYYEYFLCKRV